MQVFTILTMGVLLMYLMPPLLDDFLKITASFFNFGPELNNGKSPLESIGAAIFFVVKVDYYLFNTFSNYLYSDTIYSRRYKFFIKIFTFKFEKMNQLKV